MEAAEKLHVQTKLPLSLFNLDYVINTDQIACLYQKLTAGHLVSVEINLFSCKK